MSPEENPEDYWFVYIDREIIAANVRDGTERPPIKMQKGLYGDPTWASRVKFAGEVIYRPSGQSYLPLVRHTEDGVKVLPGDTGARLLIACPEKPEIIDGDEPN